MRCEDLTRELASPTGACSPAEMAGHLADCPGCAEWSRKAARLDQIWEATRPLEPTSAMLDALWASASVALEAPAVPATIPFERLKPRRSWLMTASLLASAAAILMVVGFVLFRRADLAQVAANTPVKPAPVTNQTPQIPPLDEFQGFATVKLDVEVGVDESAFVRIGVDPQQTEAFVSTVAPSTLTNSIPAVTSFDLFNSLEAMAERPVVVTSR